MPKIAQIWSIIKGVKGRMDDANLSLVAAGSAFFVMLSLFPGLAALVAIVGFVADPAIVDDQLVLLSDFIPEQVMTIVDTQIRQLVEASTGSALGWATLLSILAATWSARRGTDALIQAVNRVYHLPVRGGFMAAITALGLTVGLMSVVTIATLALVVVPIILAFLPLGSAAGATLGLARWGAALAVVITGIWMLYRFAPNRKGFKVAWITPGSLLAIGVWFAASWGFGYYLTNFGSYNEIYGSIGAVIALLMFLYLSIFVILLGATLNAELEELRSKSQTLEKMASPPQDLSEMTKPEAVAGTDTPL